MFSTTVVGTGSIIGSGLGFISSSLVSATCSSTVGSATAAYSPPVTLLPLTMMGVSVASMSESVGGFDSGARVSLTATGEVYPTTGAGVSSLTMLAPTSSSTAGSSTTMAGPSSALRTSTKGATSTLTSVIGCPVTGTGPGLDSPSST